ncbi:hypothetical protein I5L01_13730 [Erythrobacter sp. YJ-T3-07]|uniref:hypothetical protein n=1 Tax=Erythrobacter sp. YJ-T3-07 TaxID=2793063 RepID=UPI0018D29756|nr:hypothetical protein [Erythrobacter sp. YJ-T3-07]MBH1945284.1 hypothetical protein [Erythrobacter sp. YJ-T3-07]
MTQSPAASWTRLAFDTWALSMEASCVIWLRSMRIMAGGKLAESEAERMVSEKLTAAMTLMPAIMAGGANQSAEEATGRALAHYAKPVRANRRRLTR